MPTCAPATYPQGFKLCMVVNDIYTDTDKYNPIATYLFNNLKSMSYVLSGERDAIHGTVYVTNERNWEVIDFSTQELSYVMRKMKTV